MKLSIVLAVFAVLAAVALQANGNPNDDVYTVEPPMVQQHVSQNGVNRCTYGPAYYCRTMNNRKECNKVEHCEQRGYPLED